MLPDYNSELDKVAEIADTDSTTGLFATADEKFDSVTLPMDLEKVGKNAFRDSGLKRWLSRQSSRALAILRSRVIASRL